MFCWALFALKSLLTAICNSVVQINDVISYMCWDRLFELVQAFTLSKPRSTIG